MLAAVRTITAAEVIERIGTELAKDPSGVVAFDGDGTLWSGDIGEDFFHALLEDGRILKVALDALVREAQSEQLDAQGGGVELARRIYDSYVAGRFPEERACEIMTWAFAGWHAPEMDAFAARVVAKVDLRARLHAETMRIVEWAREEGVATYLVSASPRAVVEQAARVVGIDVANVVSATEERDASDRVRPSVIRPIPYGPGKVLHLRRKIVTRPLVAAFGDNVFDIPMLHDATLGVAIRPKPRLLARANELAEVVVLERA